MATWTAFSTTTTRCIALSLPKGLVAVTVIVSMPGTA